MLRRDSYGMYYCTVSTFSTLKEAEARCRENQWAIPLFPLEVVAWQIKYKDSPPSVINDAREVKNLEGQEGWVVTPLCLYPCEKEDKTPTQISLWSELNP